MGVYKGQNVERRMLSGKEAGSGWNCRKSLNGKNQRSNHQAVSEQRLKHTNRFINGWGKI